MPIITFSNKHKKVYQHSISVKNIIKEYNEKLRNICVAVLINNNLSDINKTIKKDTTIQLITINDLESLQVIRNSCIQLLSYAVKSLWPTSKTANGSITENGFFCDIELKTFLTTNDIYLIEKKMNSLIKKKYVIKKKQVSINKAKELFERSSESYKINILNNFKKKNNKIDLYVHECNYDIAINPQVPNVQFCQHFKIQKVSGAYWKGNKNNQMLQRIHGTAWESKKKLIIFLKKINDSKNIDHRKINKKLNLYHIQKKSPGMVFWHNNGFIIYQELEKLIRKKLNEYCYQEVKTPIMINKSMWEKSGHLDYYENSIFSTSSEKRKYCLKPMNCPAHIQIFNQKIVSYKDLPIRLAEFGQCHRNESSGSLHGLLRTRSFTQDDAHIFCTLHQIKNEISNCIKMIFSIYKIFKFKKINVKFSTRPKKRIGNDTIWDQAEQSLQSVLNDNKINFQYNVGEGAFYGPKIEFTLQDSLDRLWQCGTIQLDFYLPHRLNATYIDQYNKKNNPIMIHRAILGSIERFIGILLEEYMGKLPTWLSPVQIVLISVKQNNINYIQNIDKQLKKIGIRTKCDTRNENISTKIREHIIHYIPYLLICGDQEERSSTITIKSRSGKNLKNICLNNFTHSLIKEINAHSNTELEE